MSFLRWTPALTPVAALLFTISGLSFAGASAGCSGARSGLEGSIYRDAHVTFRVGDVPAGWQPISVEDASLAYRDEAHRASVLVNARCGRKDDDTPLAALTAHLVMGTTDRET